MKCYRILFLVFLLAYNHTLNAQSVKDFNIFNFTNDNGLPQNSVKSIEQDRDGYLWMATEAGLVRFDGKNFRIYHKDDPSFLRSSRISHVGLMYDGNVYFIDENGNIYTKNNRGQIGRLAKKANTELFIGLDRGLYEPLAHLDAGANHTLMNQFIGYWTNNVLFIRTTDTCTGFISVNKNTIAFAAHKRIMWIDSLISCNKHLRRSCGTLNNRFYYMDYDYRVNSLDSTGRERKINISGLRKTSARGRPSDYSMFQQDKELYLLYASNIYQLTYRDEYNLDATFLLEAGNLPNISSFRNLPRIDAYAVGSVTKGFFLLKKKRFDILRLPETDNIFYAQCNYGDSGVLTHFGVLMPHKTIRLPFDKIQKLAIHKDRQGYYWLNRAPGSVLQVDEHFNILREIKSDDLYVSCFAETPDGSIWVLTNKNKIGKIERTGIRWLTLQASHNSMRTLLPVDNDNFWIGGSNHLLKINIPTRRITRYNYFRDHDVRCLYLDKENILWIGTYGKGLLALKDGQLIRLPLDAAKNLNFICTMLEDRRGNVWITTNNGMFRARKCNLLAYLADRSTDVYYQYYAREQGFLTSEFNGGCNPSGIELKDGTLSFPSMDGLVRFHPDSLRDIYPSSRIFIDDLFADGKALEIKDGLLLPPSFNRLEINISSPYYDNPFNQQIEYKLAELDDSWYPVSGSNTITFNRLPYGKYHLLFRKKGGFGINNYITSSIWFSVNPFFYQEWYFKAGAVVLLVLLVLLFFRLRYFILIKKQHKLEQKVQQRTRELVYNNRLREKLTLLIAHDLQSPLHFLTILARHVHKAAQNEDLGSVLEGSEEIKKTTAKIYSFVEEFNLWNMSLSENYKLNKTTFLLIDLLEELKQFFEEMLRLKNNTLALICERELHIVTDRDVLKAILRNIIDNANKYTESGTVIISASRGMDNNLQLSVSDTGNGMSEQQLEKILYRIRQVHSIPGIEKDGRLGFQLIIDFAARLEAKINVISVRKQGTTITLSGLACAN